MNYTFKQLSSIIKGNILQANVPETIIEQILFDSRKVIFPNTSIFFAIVGKRQNGHHFMEDAYNKGVRNFVVAAQQDIGNWKNKNINLLEVKDTTTALQQLATYHRQQFSLPVIGITGSNGKTIIKEWLFQLLHSDHHMVRSPKSYNSQIGVPLSILRIDKKHDLGVFEAGISKVGEMEKIAPIIAPHLGIFTNIGPAHSEGFPNTLKKIKEKAALFKNCKTLIYNIDNPPVRQVLSNIPNIKTFTWSHKQSADLQVIKVTPFQKKQTEIRAVYQGKVRSIRIPFVDEASIENAIHCWCLLLFLDYESSTIQERMLQLEPVAMRLELREGINNCTIINDSYNSDIHALEIALNFLEQQSQHEQNTLILSDILQTGTTKTALYQQVQRLIISKKVSRFIGIGEEIAVLKNQLPSTLSTAFFDHTDIFLKKIHQEELSFQNETILLKGARQFEFERIANQLARRIHQTVLEVNLDAVIHNLAVFHQYLHPTTKIMVMVKASAYGSGSVEIARLLEFQNVDYLAVAYADEGVELRRAGIQLPILVLNPEEATYDVCFQYDLEPEVYQLSALKRLAQLTSIKEKSIAIHLKIDTGMHRLGFEQKDIPAVIAILNQTTKLRVQSIFSHLAASDAGEHDAFTQQQIKFYLSIYQQLSEGIAYQPIRHILNSSGIVRFPNQQLDMVRLGIGLYGIDSSAELQNQLRVVNTLKATVSQIKHIPAGETIGYSRRGKASQDMRTATISIGYADGLLRGASNGKHQVLVRGKLAPIIGNVCMDMSMLDITHIPEVQEGDEVIIFGEHPSVETLAEALDTISYEVFTNVSQRVKRIYIQE